VTAGALAVVKRSPAGLSVAELARRVDTDPKRLIRLFTDDVGLTPKRYLRIVRFERLLNEVYARPGVDWARAAAEHGYFDQAHMIRDFKVCSGMTPETYLSRRGAAAHHAATSDTRATPGRVSDPAGGG
jgi:AraC-like DNA-binding protein